MSNLRSTLLRLVALVAGGAWACATYGAGPVYLGQGTDLAGGARAHFGANHYGRTTVNYVYAQATGPAATMSVAFPLERAPRGALALVLEAMDDDAASACRIRITLNDQVLAEGPSGFPDASWAVRRIPIPRDAWRSGTNTLTVANLEPAGPLGAPPWFMVARWALASSDYQLPAIALPTYTVRLPRRARPLPEPLPANVAEPGFKFRGTKGWMWTPEQYLEEIPWLARFKLNFLMNCYSSMFSSQLGEAWLNEWWKPLPEGKREAYIKVFRACREQGIEFCFAVHPQLASPRPLDPGNAEDIAVYARHFTWAQSQGVQWFSISLDDVSWGTGGPAAGGRAHARLVNTVFGPLKAKDPAAQMIFCPVPYWGDGTTPDHRAYLEALGKEMHPEAYVYWTGDGVVTPRITRAAAESYRRIVQHRLFLWDNYPVNDAAPALHLGPVRGRDPDLGEVIDGYLSNPLASQNRINRLPLATCADYAYNPRAYDPDRSLGQAILRLAPSRAQQRVLADLVAMYPGFLVTGGGTGANAARQQFTHWLAQADGARSARSPLDALERLTERFGRAFPESYSATKKTLADDIAWMRQQAARQGR